MLALSKEKDTQYLLCSELETKDNRQKNRHYSQSPKLVQKSFISTPETHTFEYYKEKFSQVTSLMLPVSKLKIGVKWERWDMEMNQVSHHHFYKLQEAN